MKLLVSIVNFRTPELTIKSVEAVLPDIRAIGDARVLVVDNQSEDGSLEQLATAARERGWGDIVEIVPSGHNGGQGYAVNLAYHRCVNRDAPPEYTYMLDSDAFTEPGAVRAMVEFLDAHPWVGIAGSNIKDEEGRQRVCAFRFPNVVSEFDRQLRFGVFSRIVRDQLVAMGPLETTQQVDWVSGCSIMIRRDVIEAVGGFDERFFLYWEEVDLCRQALNKGWPTYFIAESSVYHVETASTHKDDIDEPVKPYVLQSRRHYFDKNHGRRYLWAANTAWLAGFALWSLRRRIQRKPRRNPPGILGDFVRHSFER